MLSVQRTKYVIWATDIQRAVAFYRDTMGGRVLRGGDILAELEVAGGLIAIHCGGEGKRTWTGLSFQVADVVAGAREVVAGGGVLLNEPSSDSPGEQPHLAMCCDPEGNEFMLTRKRT